MASPHPPRKLTPPMGGRSITGAHHAKSVGGAEHTVFITFATDVAGSSRATGIGMMGASNRMGGFVGSAIGGVFLAIGGFTAVGIFCLVSVVLSALVIGLFMQDQSPDEAIEVGSHAYENLK